MTDFQSAVGEWMLRTFPDDVSKNVVERAMRLLEEATELGQSLGMTEQQALTVTRYVFNRPIGEPSQEVGGTMVTLAALCWAAKLNMADAGQEELDRINTPEMRAKIASKQVSKRLFGATSASNVENSDGN